MPYPPIPFSSRLSSHRSGNDDFVMRAQCLGVMGPVYSSMEANPICLSLLSGGDYDDSGESDSTLWDDPTLVDDFCTAGCPQMLLDFAEALNSDSCDGVDMGLDVDELTNMVQIIVRSTEYSCGSDGERDDDMMGAELTCPDVAGPAYGSVAGDPACASLLDAYGGDYDDSGESTPSNDPTFFTPTFFDDFCSSCGPKLLDLAAAFNSDICDGYDLDLDESSLQRGIEYQCERDGDEFCMILLQDVLEPCQYDVFEGRNFAEHAEPTQACLDAINSAPNNCLEALWGMSLMSVENGEYEAALPSGMKEALEEKGISEPAVSEPSVPSPAPRASKSPKSKTRKSKKSKKKTKKLSKKKVKKLCKKAKKSKKKCKKGDAKRNCKYTKKKGCVPK